MNMEKKIEKSGNCPACGQSVAETKSNWMHRFIEYCPQCTCGLSHGPVLDDIGEDCNLSEKVEAYKAQQSGPEPFLCDCGAKAVARFRHALADWNCITIDGEPVRKAKLLPGQGEGEGRFIDEVEYLKRQHRAELDAVIAANLKEVA